MNKIYEQPMSFRLEYTDRRGVRRVGLNTTSPQRRFFIKAAVKSLQEQYPDRDYRYVERCL